MKTSGLLLSCLGLAGLIVATTLEISTGSGLLRAINYGFATELVGGLIDHRTAIVLVSGFAFVAGVVLYGFSVTEAALERMTAMIGEAIDAPDSYPAALPAPAKVELAALRSSAGMRMTATESPVELTAIREGGARGA
jgi:hypothetical protein